MFHSLTAPSMPTSLFTHSPSPTSVLSSSPTPSLSFSIGALLLRTRSRPSLTSPTASVLHTLWLVRRSSSLCLQKTTTLPASSSAVAQTCSTSCATSSTHRNIPHRTNVPASRSSAMAPPTGG